jgi:hypothetical protein
MINIEQMSIVLDTLPDPAFILSRSGKYVAVFGGRDKRYYHDGSGLVGLYISDLIKPDKANWFLEQIGRTLESGELIIEEYELSNSDGIALTFISEKEQSNFKSIENFLEKEIYKIPIPEELGEAPEYKPRPFSKGKGGNYKRKDFRGKRNNNNGGKRNNRPSPPRQN